ncbi:MAG: hypothetical protein V3S69_04225 [Dehalococcoidales bacterium]
MVDEASQNVKEQTPEEIEARILHLLGVYPVISPTMLQGGLGPYTKPALWRPVLVALLGAKKVVETQESLQTPSGRYNTYTKLSLAGTKVTASGA